MSANRRHATAPELGWLDLEAAIDSTDSGVFRAQGRVYTRDFRTKRFNRAVRFDGTTTRDGQPAMRVQRVRFNRRTGLWADFGETMTLRWDRLDWISFRAAGDPNGTWMKVTVEGQSDFGEYSVDEYGNLLHFDTGRIWAFGDRAEAVAEAVRRISA